MPFVSLRPVNSWPDAGVMGGVENRGASGRLRWRPFEAASAAAPIFQPGAPGQPSKPITASQSLEIGRSAVNPLDVKFMQDMIEHHAQAVEMVELLQTRTNRNSMQPARQADLYVAIVRDRDDARVVGATWRECP